MSLPSLPGTNEPSRLAVPQRNQPGLLAPSRYGEGAPGVEGERAVACRARSSAGQAAPCSASPVARCMAATATAACALAVCSTASLAPASAPAVGSHLLEGSLQQTIFPT